MERMSEVFSIIFSKKSKKHIQRLDRNTKLRVRNSILKLAENPYDTQINDIRPLKGYKDTYRLRIGDLRVLYKVENQELIILVLEIGSRGDIYK